MRFIIASVILVSGLNCFAGEKAVERKPNANPAMPMGTGPGNANSPVITNGRLDWQATDETFGTLICPDYIIKGIVEYFGEYNSASGWTSVINGVSWIEGGILSVSFTNNEKAMYIQPGAGCAYISRKAKKH